MTRILSFLSAMLLLTVPSFDARAKGPQSASGGGKTVQGNISFKARGAGSDARGTANLQVDLDDGTVAHVTIALDCLWIDAGEELAVMSGQILSSELDGQSEALQTDQMIVFSVLDVGEGVDATDKLSQIESHSEWEAGACEEYLPVIEDNTGGNVQVQR